MTRFIPRESILLEWLILLFCILKPLLEPRAFMSDFKKYHCLECEHIYDEAQGDPDSGIAPGTRWEDIPDDWECPICGAPKSFFKLME
jgi:rubredoxin